MTDRKYPWIAGIEDQASIAAWSDATFGPITNMNRSACRILSELSELADAIALDRRADIEEELADVIITSCGLATLVGADLDEPVKAYHTACNPRGRVARAVTQIADIMAATDWKVDRSQRDQYLALTFSCLMMPLADIAGHYGIDLGAAIDRKMIINRARQWTADGSGRHVEGA